MAAELLTPLPSVLIQNGAPVESVQAVMTSLWQEFALPCLQGSGSPEGIAFWEALETTNDSLCLEAMEIFSNNVTCKSSLNTNITEVLQASRGFFYQLGKVYHTTHGCDTGLYSRWCGCLKSL